jgi:hypothetical protein
MSKTLPNFGFKNRKTNNLLNQLTFQNNTEGKIPKDESSDNKVIWDNSFIMENIKYCKPPRFLIVEDNVNSRMSIKHLLKKFNKDIESDYAANGKEAIRKFKNLFNKGYILII